MTLLNLDGSEETDNQMELIGRLLGVWNTGQRGLVEIVMYGSDIFGDDQGPFDSFGTATLTFTPLAATPEPPGLFLLGSGALAALGWIRRKAWF